MILEICKTNINYEIIGSGTPLILFSGYINDMTAMIKTLEPIFRNREGLKRIYVDHPGVGNSDSGDIKRLSEYLKVIKEFVGEITKGEDFIVAGYSFGGYLSRYILQEYFNQVKGMMLITPLTTNDLSSMDVDRNVEAIPHKNQNKEAYIQNRIEKDINHASLKSNHTFLETIQIQAMSEKVSLDNFQGKFHGPTLIMTGRQDNVVGYKDAYALLEKYPRASYFVLDMCGHDLQIQQEELFNLLVVEWLERLSL